MNDRRFLHAAEVLGLLYIFTVTKLNPCTWLSPMQQGWEWVGISSIFSLLSSFQTFPIFPSNSSDRHVHILLLSLIVCHRFSLPFSTSTFLFFILWPGKSDFYFLNTVKERGTSPNGGRPLSRGLGLIRRILGGGPPAVAFASHLHLHLPMLPAS